MDEMQATTTFPDEFYQTLTRVIREENDSLIGLEENLDQQYNVLIEQKLPEFLQVLKEQRNLLVQSFRDERLRNGTIQSFIPDMKNQSLHELIDSSPETHKETLSELKIQFDKQVDRITRKRDRNKSLIQKSLDVLQSQIQHLRSLHQSGYDASGNHESKDFSVINRQV